MTIMFGDTVYILKSLSYRSTWGMAGSGPCGRGACSSKQRVVGAPSLQTVTELLQVGHSVEVDEGCSHHQHVEDLMRLKLRKRDSKQGRNQTQRAGKSWRHTGMVPLEPAA